MIPLQLSAEFACTAQEPFVTVLIDDQRHIGFESVSNSLFEHHKAVRIRGTGDELQFSTSWGRMNIRGAKMEDLAGDVILAIPRRGVIHRLVRRSSQHNTLLVTERCDQLCIMCSQPPKKHHVDQFRHFEVAIRLAPSMTTIGLSGGEPTLYKDQLFDFLLQAQIDRPDLAFHVLSNAQHFLDEDLAKLAKMSASKICWGIPIYSARDRIHDAIVGKQGAFSRLLRSFRVLMRAGSSVELRTVLLKDNVADLPHLASFVCTHLTPSATWAVMQLENIGFARKNWDKIFWDNSKRFEEIALAIDICTARGIDVSLYNFPLCTIPDAYRKFAARSISDWKQKYLSICKDCSHKSACSGFFEWYSEDGGFAGIHPI